VGSCEHSTEPSELHKAGNFLMGRATTISEERLCITVIIMQRPP